jgi:hypothetical protein
MRDTKTVVPAKAGTHTLQRFGSITKAELSYDNSGQGLWVPACAGTTVCVLRILRKTILLTSPAD